jgi:hypothetical protein
MSATIRKTERLAADGTIRASADATGELLLRLTKAKLSLQICLVPLVEYPMLMDAAVLLGVFVAGYSLRAWISARRRRAMRKARGD